MSLLSQYVRGDEARTQVQEEWVFLIIKWTKTSPKWQSRQAEDGNTVKHNTHWTKDNGSAQDCRHQEAKIVRQTRVTRETRVEPLKQWLVNKTGEADNRQKSTWHQQQTTSHVLNTETQRSGGQPGHTSRTVTPIVHDSSQLIITKKTIYDHSVITCSAFEISFNFG